LYAEIITIGDEILIGQIVDTNSAFISKELNNIGVSVYQITSVQDDKEHILKAIAEAEENADIIILTGGLGPTKDDITKRTIAEYFDDTLVQNEAVLENIEYLFKKFISTPISEVNRHQALVPSKSTVLMNKFGTAPGMLLEKEEKTFISLPGVPYEMRALISYEVLPFLQKKYHCPYIIHKTLLTYGLGESAIANRISDFEDNLPKEVKLAYLPNLGKVRLRLSGKSYDKEQLESTIERLSTELISYVEDIFVGFEGEGSLEASIGELLVINNQTLATAESCTGGTISKMITAVPGASQYFKGSVVSYSEQVKIKQLDVPKELIQKFSVVSAEVAKSMALGIQKNYNVDFAIAVTGNAGPTKDMTDASLGQVYIAIAAPDQVIVRDFNFGQPREKVIQKASIKALELLKSTILRKTQK
jgi:nicotinamide-nucleotide amidase